MGERKEVGAVAALRPEEEEEVAGKEGKGEGCKLERPY